MSSSKPVLLSIVGPTAVGKTETAIKLARTMGTEIISADSRQFYQEMEIGTAKPTDKELNMVRHHFINTHSVHDFYSAGAFERDALALLEKLFNKYELVIAVGGSGLYFKALWEGLDDIPKPAIGVREELNLAFQTNGLGELLIELQKEDPEYFEQVDKQNHQRIIRAIEVIRSTGKKFSSFRIQKGKTERFFRNVKIGLKMERGELNERIDKRMDQMIANGLFDEAERLFDHRHLNALQTVGYKEIFGFLEGAYDQKEAVRLLKRNSRRYAKRQMTWFSADEDIYWISENGNLDAILSSLEQHPQ